MEQFKTTQKKNKKFKKNEVFEPIEEVSQEMSESSVITT